MSRGHAVDGNITDQMIKTTGTEGQGSLSGCTNSKFTIFQSIDIVFLNLNLIVRPYIALHT